MIGFGELDGADLVPGAPPPAQVEETGATFLGNAVLKAVHASSAVLLPVVADDSGLCVDALGGAPGVRSARHGGPGLDDRARFGLVLDAMRGLPAQLRGAHYRAAVVLARAGRVLSVHEGTVAGSILEAPRGTGGFGYDPIFLVAAHGKSMAEISAEEKDAVSHRARAFVGLRKALAAHDAR